MTNTETVSIVCVWCLCLTELWLLRWFSYYVLRVNILYYHCVCCCCCFLCFCYHFGDLDGVFLCTNAILNAKILLVKLLMWYKYQLFFQQPDVFFTSFYCFSTNIRYILGHRGVGVWKHIISVLSKGWRYAVCGWTSVSMSDITINQFKSCSHFVQLTGVVLWSSRT